MLHSVLQLLEGDWHLDLALANAGEVDGEAVALGVEGEHQVVGVLLPPQLQLGPQNNVFTPHTWNPHRQKLLETSQDGKHNISIFFTFEIQERGGGGLQISWLDLFPGQLCPL